jgi:hypothetical protein
MSSQFVYTSSCLVTDSKNVLLCSPPYRLVTVLHLTQGSKCSHLLECDCDSQLTAKLLLVLASAVILVPNPTRLMTIFYSDGSGSLQKSDSQVFCCVMCSLHRTRVYWPFPSNGNPFSPHYSRFSPHATILTVIRISYRHI